MEYLPENNSGQDNHSAPTSLGRLLREARLGLNLSVADVAAQIKFAPRQIEALEADDFKQLPEAAFLRGFVRSYAKSLNLDAQTLLAALPQPKVAVAEMIPASVDVPFPVAHSSQKYNLILLGAALLLAVIVVGFAVWHFTNPLKSPQVAQIETPVSLPAETQLIPTPPVPEQNLIAAPAIPAQPKLHSSVTAEFPSTPLPKQAAKTAVVQPVPKIHSTDSTTNQGTSPETTTLRLIFVEESWTEITDKEYRLKFIRRAANLI
jgi:cytoskeleton protein RodZ